MTQSLVLHQQICDNLAWILTQKVIENFPKANFLSMVFLKGTAGAYIFFSHLARERGYTGKNPKVLINNILELLYMRPPSVTNYAVKHRWHLTVLVGHKKAFFQKWRHLVPLPYYTGHNSRLCFTIPNSPLQSSIFGDKTNPVVFNTSNTISVKVSLNVRNMPITLHSYFSRVQK